jgi:hypothetical protein
MYHEMPQKTFKYRMMNCMANNIHNTLHMTPTNDKNVGLSKIIPIDNQSCKSGLGIAPLMTFKSKFKG